MKQYEKLAEDFMNPIKSYIDPKVETVGLDAFVAGFLKAREMADDLLFYASASELEDLDLLRLGEKEV